jgi:glycosyltransferase involved in cell wall biosynthesis
MDLQKTSALYEAKNIVLLMENIRLTGGVRQALKLIGESGAVQKKEIWLIRRTGAFLRARLGELKDYIIASKNKPRGIKLRFAPRVIYVDPSAVVISTSCKTLKSIKNPGHVNHWHYCQHIEFWDLLNAEVFVRYCVSVRYPNAADIFFMIDKYPDLVDKKYVENFRETNNFLCVSRFLVEIIDLIHDRLDKNVALVPVEPHIKGRDGSRNCELDVLFFIRGIPFKGDELAWELIDAISGSNYVVGVVLSAGSKLNKRFRGKGIKFYANPPDNQLGRIYASANVVVNTSLCEGFGSIPQEALSYGCKVVTSNTGWIADACVVSSDVQVIDRHDKNKYLVAITELCGRH